MQLMPIRRLKRTGHLHERMVRKSGRVHCCTFMLSLADFPPSILYAVILIVLRAESSSGASGRGVVEVEPLRGMGQHLSKDTGDINMENGNFPSTLKEFGYEIKEGKLRNIRTGGKFVFDVKKGNRRYNQQHYEAIGEVITQEVYKMLEEKAGLVKVTIPVKEEMAEEKDPKGKKAESFIFMSENTESYKKLMILIHGTGVVRAGQWARSLIINDCLDSGTQLPYIHRAKEEGYGVVVLNTNQHTDINGGDDFVQGSETPEDHFVYVWDHFIKDVPVDDIVIVAHSYGGVVALEGVKSRPQMMTKVKAIAFTDGVHSLFHQAGKNNKVVEWFRKHSVNWVSSNQPLNQKLKSINGSEPKYSAGTMRHEQTSWTAMEPIFQYFRETLETRKESEVREWISNGFPLASQAQSTAESSEKSSNKNEGLPVTNDEKDIKESETESRRANNEEESTVEDKQTEESKQDVLNENASEELSSNEVEETVLDSAVEKEGGDACGDEQDSSLTMDVEEKSPLSVTEDVEMSTQDDSMKEPVSSAEVQQGDVGMTPPPTESSSETPDDSQTMETSTPVEDKDESKDEL